MGHIRLICNNNNNQIITDKHILTIIDINDMKQYQLVLHCWNVPFFGDFHSVFHVDEQSYAIHRNRYVMNDDSLNFWKSWEIDTFLFRSSSIVAVSKLLLFRMSSCSPHSISFYLFFFHEIAPNVAHTHGIILLLLLSADVDCLCSLVFILYILFVVFLFLSFTHGAASAVWLFNKCWLVFV